MHPGIRYPGDGHEKVFNEGLSWKQTNEEREMLWERGKLIAIVHVIQEQDGNVERPSKNRPQFRRATYALCDRIIYV